MSRSGRSNVVTWLTSKAFGVRPLAAVKPTAFLFSAVRLSMPFARLSDSVTRKTLKLFRKPRRSSLRYLRFLRLVLAKPERKALQKARRQQRFCNVPVFKSLRYLRFLLLRLVLANQRKGFYRIQR